jgi:hypothetical protein
MSEPKNAAQMPDLEPCSKCGDESDYGAHGIKNGQIYSEYWCATCWSERGRKPFMRDDDVDEAAG